MSSSKPPRHRSKPQTSVKLNRSRKLSRNLPTKVNARPMTVPVDVIADAVAAEAATIVRAAIAQVVTVRAVSAQARTAHPMTAKIVTGHPVTAQIATGPRVATGDATIATTADAAHSRRYPTF